MHRADYISFALLGLVQLANAIGLAAVDFGTDAFKVALVAPRVPFDVILNPGSQRKTTSAVTLRGIDERLVGSDAAALGTRLPRDSFLASKYLLGRHDGYGAATFYRSLFPNSLHESERGTTAVSRSNASLPQLSAEELVSMQFAYASDMAKRAAGEKVSDVVVTVPAFYDHFERQAVLDALDLANFKPLALVNDGTAIAVQYAVNRAFPAAPAAEHHLFYDAGAGSTRATVVSFSKIRVKDHPSSKDTKEATEVVIRGVGYDRLMGGLALDSIIREALVADFERDHGSKLLTPLRENERAMAKLLKEAARVKHVLSANAQSLSRVEALAEEIDFKSMITRDAFEAACAERGFSERFARPISDALAAAKLSVGDLTSAVLVGGSSRVPLVQAAVKSVVPEDKIATNLNADEAAVFGAVFFGAGISRQYRMQDIRVRDVTQYPVDLVHDSTVTPVFAFGAEHDSKEVISLTRSTDGVVHLVTPKTTTGSSDKSRPHPSCETCPPYSDLLSLNLSGVSSRLVNYTDAQRANASVQLTIQLDRSGLVTVPSAVLKLPYNATAAAEEADSSVTGRLKNLFGGKDKDKDAAASADAAPSDGPEDIEAILKRVKAETASAKKATDTVRLYTYPEGGSVPAMSTTDKLDARKRLREFDQAETRRRAREEARNGLEAYIYRLRDQLEESSFVTASTADEREIISSRLASANEWLWEAAEKAPTKDLRSKKSDLERLARTVTNRMDEAKARTGLVTDLQVAIFSAQAFHMSADSNATAAEAAGDPLTHTRAELDALRDMLSTESRWLEDSRSKQDKLKPNEDPVLRRIDLERRTRDINAELTRLRRKKPPRRTATTTSSSDTAAEETPAATESTPPASSETTTTAPARPTDEL